MFVVLATLAALTWGLVDFSGGKAARRSRAVTVVVAGQLMSLPLLAACVIAMPGGLRLTDMGWGALAGVAEVSALTLQYRGFAMGAMTVVAPISALTAAVLPIIFGFITAGQPSGLATVGIACALIAVGLVCGAPGSSLRRATVAPHVFWLAVASGSLFGIYFVLIAQTGPGGGVWGLAGLRGASVVWGLLLASTQRLSLRVPSRVLPWVAVAGLGDIAANVAYLLATRQGPISVVAPIAALAPAATIVLAIMVDRERLRPVQFAGLGLAVAALALIAS